MAEETEKYDDSWLGEDAFIRIPRRHMIGMDRGKITLREAVVISIIEGYPAGDCYIGDSGIGRRVGLNENTVGKIIRKLTDSGYIVRHRIYNPVKKQFQRVMWTRWKPGKLKWKTPETPPVPD